MTFPLSSANCDAMEAVLIQLRSEVRESNPSAYSAYNNAIQLLHDSRMGQANRHIAAKQRKANKR